MTRRRFFLLVYVVLLLASNLVRWLDTDEASPGELAVAQVQLTDAQPVRIAYADLGPRDAPVVIALHGSPAAGGFASLAPALSDRYRVVVPHLPGFGRSTRRVDDYSIDTHARYVLALMNELGVERASFIGYSMGGGVALSLYERAPERVVSAVLLSAIGVQELEMFGHYALNHVVHGVQLAALTAVTVGVPHFGALDGVMLNTRYARNFYDTDQRPLRDILSRFEPPLLIVHGDADPLVPYAAAKEHHRIVPHSELVTLDGGHGLVFRNRSPVIPPITTFLDRVITGSAPRRADASSDRLTLAAEPLRDHVAVTLTGLALVLAILTLAVSTLISEDAACIAAGLLVAGGIMTFWPAALACLAGIYIGDALVFAAGRHLGAPSLTRAPMRWFISTDGVETAKAWFTRRGPAAIIISRFVPGTRFPTYLAAGALGLSFARFSGWFLLASILWTPTLVALAASAGSAIQPVFERYSAYALPVVLGLVLAMMLLMRLLLPLATYRGRRLALGRWRRLTRWEFWPRWAFYPPVVLYVLYLGMRYRAPTLFTAANPAMPDGGFVGESKTAILDSLGKGPDDVVAPYQLLPSGTAVERADAVAAFMASQGTDFPIVLKPDVGERGSDVCIARNTADVEEYLNEHDALTLVQVFAPGHEFGVFYVRLPHDDAGRIFAITDKRPPSVVGDGERTLERLILDDDRAVCMAPTYLAGHVDQLYRVPADGERITLVDVGTHSRGCVFLDGQWLHTPELARAIDRVSQGYDGFFFGRYDLRAPDIEALKRGIGYKVVELNGVSSEATNIYDPKNGLLTAYGTLLRQWRLAFEIGAANRQLGARPTPTFQFLRRVLSGR